MPDLVIGDDQLVGFEVDEDAAGAADAYTPDLIGQIDIVTCSGVCIGWVGSKGPAAQPDCVVEIACGDAIRAPVSPDILRPDLAAAGIAARGFRIALTDGSLAAGDEVVLSAIVGEERQLLATASVAGEAGRIDWADPSGRVQGFAVAEGEWPLAVELTIEDRRVCTALADRYCAEMAGGKPPFVGFSAWIPTTELKRCDRRAVLSLRRLQTGSVLFAAPLSRLLSRHEIVVRRRLPIDAVVKREFEAVYSNDMVTRFYNMYGPEIFVEMAYCYVLERMSDPGGREALIRELIAGQVTPRGVMHRMYHSSERAEKGAFMGPFVGDPGYPFILGSADAAGPSLGAGTYHAELAAAELRAVPEGEIDRRIPGQPPHPWAEPRQPADGVEYQPFGDPDLPEGALVGTGFHPAETNGASWWRWTGPERQAQIRLPVAQPGQYRVAIWCEKAPLAVLDGLAVRCFGEEAPVQISAQNGSASLVCDVWAPAAGFAGWIDLELQHGPPDHAADGRMIGLCIGSIRLEE
ncbi:MAG TPA: hypothetical protein VM755_00925 [Stellaceae bacterium]|nr:hypothetical protein [Stellaceae bacterium]